MNLVNWVEINGSRRSLRKRPEWAAFIILLIDWINVQELLNIVEEVLLETHASKFDTVIKSLWHFLDHFDNFFVRLHFLLIREIEWLVLFQNDNLVEALRF